MKQKIQAKTISLVLAVLLGVVLTGCDEKDLSFESPFPHVTHFEMGIECSQCHEPDGMEISFPSPASCTGCHDLAEDGTVGAICSACHTVNDEFRESEKAIRHRAVEQFGAPLPVAYEETVFNHEPFLEDQTQCLSCHARVEEEELKEVFMPDMDLALAFYAESGQPEPPCSTCHSMYDIDTEPTSHKAPAWMREHGLTIEFEGKDQCSYCHEENMCTTCHEQMMPQNHTALFRLQTHGLEAEWGRESCSTCHRVDFCTSCHNQVRPRSHNAGWTGPMNNHCMDCHTETGERSSCYACHDPGVAETGHVANAAMPTDPRYAPAHFPGSPCMICHDPVSGTTGPRLRHPVTEEDQCGVCHRF